MAEDEQQIDPTYEINYIRSLIEQIDAQMTSLVRGLDEVRRAYNVLKDQDVSASAETRVALGAGVYANARIDLDQKLLVPIGSSIYIEETREETASRLDTNIQEIETSLESMRYQRTELSNRYQGLVSMMQQQEAQGQQKGGVQ